MKNKLQIKSARVRTLGIFMLGVLFMLGLNFIVVYPVRAESAALIEREFIVQLRQNNPAVLEALGRDVVPRFAFSSDPDLKFVYTFHSTHSLAALQTFLANNFEYLEENKKFDTDLENIVRVLPNDPGFTTNVRDVDRQWGLTKSNFPKAWTKTTGTTNTVVAIVDTGIDETHEDLRRGRYIAGYDFINHDSIGRGINSDDNGHGTLVAGIIGATANNEIGIVGTNWKVTLMPVKALNEKGSGTAADISEAIVWAADNGADIINLSIGGIGFGHNTTLANSISHAFEKDVTIIAAAGNDVAVTGGNLDIEPVFPICDDNGQNMILGVAASDSNDLKPAFSNFGISCVDVIAPGKRILSTINHDPLSHAAAPNAYAYASGTSMSVPFVVGQAALLKTLFPSATNRQIRDRIISTAENVDALNLSQCNGESCKGKLGAGRIDAAKSMEQEIVTFVINEEDLVRVDSTQQLFYINGGRRHLVSSFVQLQRFSSYPIKHVPSITDVEGFPEGALAEPLSGTLIKQGESATVYYMEKGLKLPVTGQVFRLRNFSFANVVTLSGTELGSWLTGNFLAPPDGTLVRTPGNPTVYWVVGSVLHPINHGFYIEKGLNVFPVVYISDIDLKNFSKGDSLVR